jgi:RNA polymerase sigma factor for flagellar operon FliA
MIDKEQLVVEHIEYVHTIARDVYQRMSDSNVEYDDLVGYGKIGLMEAAEKFNPQYGVRFKTFAYYRIKGAIYDGLRKMGWLSRMQYTRYKFEHAANNILQDMYECSTGRKESGIMDEIAELKNTIASLVVGYVLSLDAAENIDIKDETGVDPHVEYEMKEEKEILQQLIQELPPREQELINMYYYNNLTLEEIGNKLGLSKSWVSRLHARVIEKLREGFRKCALLV